MPSGRVKESASFILRGDVPSQMRTNVATYTSTLIPTQPNLKLPVIPKLMVNHVVPAPEVKPKDRAGGDQDL